MRSKQLVCINDTERAMMLLAYGEHEPDMLSALRNSALSSRTQLISNAGYALVLHKYRTLRLPDRLTLALELSQATRQDGSNKKAWGLMQSHIDTLYAIDNAWFNGLISLDYGTTLTEQRVWRRRMVELIKGMGDKLISWALFIYTPTDCKLMTIDCIHCNRIGIDQKQLSSKSKGNAYYQQVEDKLIAECKALHPGYLPTITAAMLWLNHRGQGITSHAGISCR